MTFLMCVFVMITLILISRGLQMRDIFLGLDLSFPDIALLFFYMTPMFMLMVLPISCMVSVFLTFLRMSTDRELIALKSGGVSVYQLLGPSALFSFVCMCIALFISLHAISWGMHSFRSTVLHIANTRAKLVVQPGVFNKDIFGLTLFARQVDPDTGKLRQVIFEESTQGAENSITVLAPEGEIVTEPDKGEMVFHLYNGRLYRVDDDNLSVLEFKSYAVHLDLSKVFSGISLGDVRPKEMAWRSLQAIASEENPEDGRYQRHIRVEMQKRWSLPVACLVLGVFALPLACAFEGVKRQLGMVLALAMFLLYYSVYSMGLSMGESGLMPPGPALWQANVLFALAAALGLHLTYKERVPSITAFVAHLNKRLLSGRRKEGRS